MTKEDQPKVSIVIPVYNGARYMGEAINSALAQTYPNIEVIVVNDGSKDNGATSKIAKSYGNKIRYFEKPNGGVATALNLGIKKMTGDYFCWLSHDDVFYPYKVQAQIDFLKENKINRPVVLYSDSDVIDENSKIIGSQKVKHIEPGQVRGALLSSSQVHGCSVLIPKECFDKLGLFNESLKIVQDYEMWFRLAGQYQFIHQPEVLIQGRVHSKQVTVTRSSECVEEGDRLNQKMLDEISDQEIKDSIKKSVTRFYWEAAVGLQLRGYPKSASYAMFKLQKCLAKRSIFLGILGIVYVLKFRLLQILHGAVKVVR